jgi:UDP-glucose 4-epimerase
VLRTARAVTGCPIPTADAGRCPGDVPYLVASADRALRELRWAPQRPGLHQMVDDAWTFLHGHLGCRADLGSVVVA